MNREAYKRRQRRVKKRAERKARRVLFVPDMNLGQGQAVQGYLADAVPPVAGVITLQPRYSSMLFTSTRLAEGVAWVRGWYGEIPDAFRAQVALLNE